ATRDMGQSIPKEALRVRFSVAAVQRSGVPSVMSSSPMIVLFGDPLPSRRGPSAFLISFLLHGGACCLLYLGLNQVHTVAPKTIIDRYAVRIMELHRPEPKTQPPAQKVTAHTGQQPSTSLATSAGGPETAPAPRIPANFISQKQALQTLVQPDAP